MSKQQVQLKEKGLTSGQRQLLEYLKHEQVGITDTGKRVYMTKFGLEVKTVQRKTFEAIKESLTEHVGVNHKLYSLNKNFTNG